MGLSGLVGAGAADALAQQLAEQLQRELFEEQQRQAQAREAQAAREATRREAADADASRHRQFLEAGVLEDRARVQNADRDAALARETAGNIRSDLRNVMDMPGMSPDQINSEIKKIGVSSGGIGPIDLMKLNTPQMREVTKRGPNGEPINAMVPYDQPVEEWRAPQEAPDPGLELTDAALDVAATVYAKTGQLPAMGMGGKAAQTRTAVINRAAELYPDVDIASETGITRADRGSLAALQKQVDAITAFEKTALANMNVFEQAAKKVADSGSPVMNVPLRAMQGRALGSAEQAAFNAARLVVLPEFARIIQNPNLTGVLTDSARQEIDNILRGDATLQQIQAIAGVLRTDAANRRRNLEAQLGEVQNRTRRRPGAEPGAAPNVEQGGAGGGVVKWETGPDGKPRKVGG